MTRTPSPTLLAVCFALSACAQSSPPERADSGLDTDASSCDFEPVDGTGFSRWRCPVQLSGEADWINGGTVLPVGDELWMWTAVWIEPGPAVVLYRSTDGRDWLQHGDPVLRPDAAAWDSDHQANFTVTRTDEGFSALYQGARYRPQLAFGIGAADSADGLTWTAYSESTWNESVCWPISLHADGAEGETILASQDPFYDPFADPECGDPFNTGAGDPCVADCAPTLYTSDDGLTSWTEVGPTMARVPGFAKAGVVSAAEAVGGPMLFIGFEKWIHHATVPGVVTASEMNLGVAERVGTEWEFESTPLELLPESILTGVYASDWKGEQLYWITVALDDRSEVHLFRWDGENE